jgi:hypothetical protein
VEALRRQLTTVHKELLGAIASVGSRVKFELLHDESPQVCCKQADGLNSLALSACSGNRNSVA